MKPGGGGSIRKWVNSGWWGLDFRVEQAAGRSCLGVRWRQGGAVMPVIATSSVHYSFESS